MDVLLTYEELEAAYGPFLLYERKPDSIMEFHTVDSIVSARDTGGSGANLVFVSEKKTSADS